jgi:hypothetical protein
VSNQQKIHRQPSAEIKVTAGGAVRRSLRRFIIAKYPVLEAVARGRGDIRFSNSAKDSDLTNTGSDREPSGRCGSRTRTALQTSS